MHARTARLLAWFLVGLYVVLATIGLTLQFLTRTYLRDFRFPTLIALTVVAGLLYVIAALIVWRHPQHPIGWLWCILIMIWEIDLFSYGYAYYGLIAYPNSLPGASLMLVWQAWTGAPFALACSTLLVLLFPDGRPLSPRWGRVGWAAVGAIALYLALDALEPGPLEIFPFLNNPIGVSETLWATLNPLRVTAITLGSLCLLAAVFSLILRLRQAQGEVRQQLKWMIYAIVYFALTLSLVFFGEIRSADTLLSFAVGLHTSSLLGLFIATAVAIFKYRLYDIDLIINRTLVYGALTGTLTLVYFMSVALLQQVFPAQSPIAIVLSTLAIAALFTPLRRRIQNAIDKRFYRRKYDAEKILASFAAIAREEVEIEKLSDTLLAVVEETIQPAQVSLWLKEVE